MHTRHSRIVIDLDAIRSNYLFLRSSAAQSRVIAVIKADAYGHGAIQVAKALPDADAFAVATSQEAMELRQSGINQKIIVLGGVVNAAEMHDCFEFNLDPVVHQFWQIELLREIKADNPVDIWLKINTGMGRLGFTPGETKKALTLVEPLSSVKQVRLMTHLANADDLQDEKSAQQIDIVKQLNLESYEWGIANSAGILGWPQSRVNWVRAGIALYGSDPLMDQRYAASLKPAMTFSSQVLAINHLKKGQNVGYGKGYICPEDQTIAVVAAGYADGYPRHLSGGSVSINGQRAPVVGRVSMDMITVNVSDMEVKCGDEVTLWGDSPLAEAIARASETISYELFCHAGCHGKREYINK
jgi:alanine racemase